jgi:hypothetical protein
VYSDDSNAPNETTYYNDSDNTVKYKDANGNLRSGGLQDGENFDGQGTSNFTNLASVGTNQVDATGVTYVEATRTTESGSISSGTFTNIIDTVNTDNNNDMSTLSFAPPETTEYVVAGHVNYRGISDQDTIAARLFNVTDDTLAARLDRDVTSGDGFQGNKWFWVGELDSTKEYEVKGADLSSSFTLNDVVTKLRIFRAVVHP